MNQMSPNETHTQPKHLVGYARVSTDDQNLTLQLDALTRHGISKSDIFTDKLSGAKLERPGLTKCLDALKPGDILVVWRLDRLGRSMRHLTTLVKDLREKGIGFRSLQEGVIDATSPSGELIFNIFSAPAQFERRLIQERTKAGLAAAHGRNGGRPKLMPMTQRSFWPRSCTRTIRSKLMIFARRCEYRDQRTIVMYECETNHRQTMRAGDSRRRDGDGHVCEIPVLY